MHRPLGNSSRLDVGEGLWRCATTISIKGRGGAACVAEAVAEGLLRQIGPCLSWRRLWALWRQFVRKTKVTTR
jgi:hypothetical protein